MKISNVRDSARLTRYSGFYVFYVFSLQQFARICNTTQLQPIAYFIDTIRMT